MKVGNYNNKKCVIYTTIFGGFDLDLYSIPSPSNLYDVVVLTDSLHILPPRITNTSVICIEVDRIDRNPRRSAKYFKVNPFMIFQEYEYSLYHDANVHLSNRIENLILDLISQGSVLGFFHHNKRNCIYEEARECIRIYKDDPNVINSQILRYSTLNYPRNNGLIQGGLIFRQNASYSVKLLMEEWWNEICLFSERDQLSFNFIAWKCGYTLKYIPGLLHSSEWTRVQQHKLVEFDESGNRRISAKIVMYNLYYRLKMLLK